MLLLKLLGVHLRRGSELRQPSTRIVSVLRCEGGETVQSSAATFSYFVPAACWFLEEVTQAQKGAKV